MNLSFLSKKAPMFMLSVFLFISTNSAHAENEVIRIYSDSGDGDVSTSPYPGSWVNQYDDETGRLVSSTDEIIRVQTAVNRSASGFLAIARGFLSFDLSSLPENAEIVSAEVGLYVSNKLDDFNDQYGYIELSEGFQESATQLVGSDVAKCGDSILLPTPISNRADVTNLVVDEYVKFTLSDPKVFLGDNSNARVCIREGHDIENQEVINNTGLWQESRIYVNSSEHPDPSTRPYLEITYTVDDEDPDPEDRDGLYTQIESPYPSAAQTSSWANDLYNNGTGGWCGSTIGECGCVLTSLVMAGRDAGIAENVVEGDVNPGTMNQYLQAVDGYTSYGALRWLAASAYFGEFQSDGTLATRLSGVPKRPVGQTAMSFISDSLTDDQNVVLAYQGGHYVWVPEQSGDEYTVLDPWWYNTRTADDFKSSTSTFVRDYNNAFTDARVLRLSEVPRAFSGTDVEAHLLSSTSELLFTNVAGQVGYADGSVLVDLQNATYGNTEIIALDGVPADADNGKHLVVYEAGEQFTIEVVGTDVGEFEFEFFTIDEFGEVTTFAASGQTLPGISTTFTFDLETGEIIEEPLSETDILSLLDVVLADLTAQQRAFFVRWMERYYGQLADRTVSQTLQQVATLEKLFVAKKVMHPLAPTVVDVLRNQITM